MKYAVFAIVCIILVSIIPVWAQVVPSPPLPPPPPKLESEQGPTTQNVTLHGNLAATFYELQMKGSTFIKKQMDILREGLDLKTLLIITFFSLGYGVFHALGPGHGKLIIMSFFMQEGTTKRDALSLSVIVSIIHSSGAILLALLFQTILDSVKGMQQIRVQYGFTLFSGILVMGIGIFYLIRLIREHNPVPKVQTPILPESSWKKNLIIGFSIGVVPCPLSLTIMMLSIVYGVFWVGLTSVLALTLAMVIVLYGISIATIKSRDYVEQRNTLKKSSPIPTAISTIISYIGTILLIVLGFYFAYTAGSAL